MPLPTEPARCILRTLVYYYLLDRHKEDFPSGAPAFDYDASPAQKRDDGFSRYYEKRPKAPKGKAVKRTTNMESAGRTAASPFWKAACRSVRC